MKSLTLAAIAFLTLAFSQGQAANFCAGKLGGADCGKRCGNIDRDNFTCACVKEQCVKYPLLTISSLAGGERNESGVSAILASAGLIERAGMDTQIVSSWTQPNLRITEEKCLDGEGKIVKDGSGFRYCYGGNDDVSLRYIDAAPGW